MTDAEMAHATGGLTDEEIAGGGGPSTNLAVDMGPAGRRNEAKRTGRSYPGPRELVDEGAGPTAQRNDVQRVLGVPRTRFEMPSVEPGKASGVPAQGEDQPFMVRAKDQDPNDPIAHDPLAGAIMEGLATNGASMLLGKGVRAIGRGFLGNKGVQAAETVAARGAEVPPGEAEMAIKAHQLNEARAASTAMIKQLGPAAEHVVATNPQIREIIELPSKLEREIAATHDVPDAREALKFKAPSLYSLRHGPTYAAAEFGAHNANALMGKLAPLAPAARALTDLPPLPTGEASLLFQAAMGRRRQ